MVSETTKVSEPAAAPSRGFDGALVALRPGGGGATTTRQEEPL